MTDFSPNQHQHDGVTTLTAEIVGAHVGHHTVAANDLLDLIKTVGKELARLGQALG